MTAHSVNSDSSPGSDSTTDASKKMAIGLSALMILSLVVVGVTVYIGGF